MDVTLIFKIATIGVVVAVLDRLLDSMGKREQGSMLTVAGLLTVLLLVLGLITQLFSSIKSMFQF
ncbi:stage III sporulation protein AC [Clostridium cylindrosporum]|uniref:Stage III sporulation protein AC n=1 Tax=Clostridium cylindrosporum DSM 605 TaxID=1121307 RepID=A0A0J8G0L7_CLOCY|nr:stage III sporulation protein AC [Clostridium cylindrosporum]KMT21341.1 stage III sporulation protein AC [Clostridium cylindrosporum DSM 605]